MSVADRYDVSVAAAGYEHVYRQAIESDEMQLSRIASALPESLPLPVSSVF